MTAAPGASLQRSRHPLHGRASHAGRVIWVLQHRHPMRGGQSPQWECCGLLGVWVPRGLHLVSDLDTRSLLAQAMPRCGVPARGHAMLRVYWLYFANVEPLPSKPVLSSPQTTRKVEQAP